MSFMPIDYQPLLNEIAYQLKAANKLKKLELEILLNSYCGRIMNNKTKKFQRDLNDIEM